MEIIKLTDDTRTSVRKRYTTIGGPVEWYGTGIKSKLHAAGGPIYENGHYTERVMMYQFTSLPDMTGKTIKHAYIELHTTNQPYGPCEICLLPETFVHDPTDYYSDSKCIALWDMVQGLETLTSYFSPGGSSASYIRNIDLPDTETFLLCATRGLAIRATTTNYFLLAIPYLVAEIANNDAPAKVTSLTPNKKAIIGNNDNTFSWEYTQEADEAQTHYDLQISNNNGVSWITIANKEETSDTERVIAGGTLASGNYLWRVRVYTRSGTVASNWAQGQFTVNNNPETSGVDCDGAPMPTITWTAVEQAAYQVKFGDYDSGTVYSADGAHTIPRYFADGVYGIQVRTQTSSGVWSEWTTPLYVEIVNEPGATIELTAFAHEYGVGLTWDGEYDNYYVLRDGVPIATVEDNAYYDALAYREHTYAVLAPMFGGYYTKSNEVSQSPALRHDIIADINTLEWIPLKYALGSRVMRNYTDSTTVTYREFAGREYPVGFVSEHKAGGLSARYAFKTAAEADAVRALVGKTIVYKDRRGGRIVGILDSASRAVGKLYDMTLTITQTDYPEAVDYEIDNAPS